MVRCTKSATGYTFIVLEVQAGVGPVIRLETCVDRIDDLSCAIICSEIWSEYQGTTFIDINLYCCNPADSFAINRQLKIAAFCYVADYVGGVLPLSAQQDPEYKKRSPFEFSTHLCLN